MRAEIHAMDGLEAADAALDLDRNVTSSSLGVFDTPLEPGEWHSAVDGGDQPGMGAFFLFFVLRFTLPGQKSNF